MLNQTIVVGRLVKTPELKVTETGKVKSNITLAVPRSYKNSDGQYETDFIDCTLWHGVAENTNEYCQKGDLLGVRGRLQTRVLDSEDGSKKKVTEIVAEKVTFLSPKNGKENKNDNKSTNEKQSSTK